MAAVKATEAEIVELLRARYCKDSGNGPAAVLIPQVRNAAGFDATRTADALVMNLWPSRGLHLEGFEVKCSRSDVLKELRQPEKAEAFARWCERWWLVLADETHIKDGELPEPWGLLVRRPYKDGFRLIAVKEAPYRPEAPKELPKTLLAALLRQVDREALRPSEAALRAEYERGRKSGEEAFNRSAQFAREENAKLHASIAAFEEATGLTVGARPEQLVRQAALIRLMIGGKWSSDGLVNRVDALARSAAKLAEEMAAAGLSADGQTALPVSP